ncbi:alpha/beta hydrolase [Rhodococcus sp. 06-156-3C]|nr:alpha/beta hydrolase [Rhodococcus sp. 06-156-4a]OZD18122.1 alpha/beta hydrolase [Rhodococcus sp. 06-156-3C]OZD20455.1 alpha/beta hydrolase [Rhodococcus sp. 06-156-4C]OZD29300.1 alpha/beta hydrolase [Rhodococcus sp. 06-156-3]OZD30726.1 alpha/beta hydrolase [Rhodococcus sp. 06-156-3b]OZF65089.1 alpha/beta hydrolase [Rhodococcus sp. 06-156-4]
MASVVVLVLCTVATGCAQTVIEPDDHHHIAPGYDSATANDEEFNRLFRHEFATVRGMQMHYVVGGTGPAMVLLHGWPQTWFEWREIMPALARTHTVYAVDLPGLGDSRGTPPSLDKATLATYVHDLVADQLGQRDIDIVGHDLGAAVAFRYAAQYPSEVDQLAYLDLPLPGPAIDGQQYRSLSWHIAFHSQPSVPEMLVTGRVRSYLADFYPRVAYRGTAFGGPGATSPFTDAEIDEYARTYDRPEVLRAGFDLYRSLDRDVDANVAARPISTPTLVMAAEGQAESVRATLTSVVTTIEHSVDVPHSGHWLVEENPEFVTRTLSGFLAP